jgi:hypothetical protein
MPVNKSGIIRREFDELQQLKLIGQELKKHAPFTALGAVTGIIIMIIVVLSGAPREISNMAFYTLHPVHVVLSALVTTAMYRRYGRQKLWRVIIIGYTGSIGIATLSDAVIPYLGGVLLNVPMEFHLPFIETAEMPYLGLAKWQVVNTAAILGIIIGYLRPTTKFPHAGHVLLSTWASLFSFTAFGIANWIPLLPFIFVFLFLAVWLPCCLSDIIYPLIFATRRK